MARHQADSRRARPREGDPEFGISRGCLLPDHQIFDRKPRSRTKHARSLQQSLVLVHGGMAQDVGPILEMVTEKYLLRSETEWRGRKQAMRILDEVVEPPAARATSAAIGASTERNFDGPIQTIIPWAGNLYTDTLIRRARAEMGDDFWGFWMLGGMSGGGMGFLFDPQRKAEAQERLQAIMSETKRAMEHAVPFAMEPVVYDFAINERGTQAALLSRRRRPDARRLLHPGRAAAAAHRSAPALRRRAARNWNASPPPAATVAGILRHGAAPLRPPAAARRRMDKAARHRQPGGAARGSRLRPRPARADPGRPAQRPHRPGAEPPAGHQPHRDADADDVWMPPALSRAIARSAGGAGRRARWPWSSLAGGVGQPLDQGRGRGQGAQSVLPAGRAAPQLHRSPPGQEPAHRPRLRHAAAARHHHQLPDPRCHRGAPARANATTAIPARCCFRPAAPSACAWFPWSATCASPGRRCRSRCSTSRRRRCARACTPR